MTPGPRAAVILGPVRGVAPIRTRGPGHLAAEERRAKTHLAAQPAAEVAVVDGSGKVPLAAAATPPAVKEAARRIADGATGRAPTGDRALRVVAAASHAAEPAPVRAAPAPVAAPDLAGP